MVKVEKCSFAREEENETECKNSKNLSDWEIYGVKKHHLSKSDDW